MREIRKPEPLAPEELIEPLQVYWNILEEELGKINALYNSLEGALTFEEVE